MPPKKRDDKEIEALRSRRRKAQDRNDIAEEAKICNAIGDVYMRQGDYRRALHYHQAELALSEGSGENLDAGIAHRRVGECLCELGDYGPAIHHQTKHLDIAKQTGDLAEEQRALATLGRTYFVQSLSGEVGEEEARELRLQAGNANLKSLDVCDKLGGVVPERELLEMRSRLYLNLGLVYQNNGDLHSARKFMEKALAIVRELGHSATILQCHLDLGSLHLQEVKPGLALRYFRDALSVASEQHSWQQEAEVYREMGQAQLLMSNFDEAKSCLKKVVRLLQENSQLAETESDQRKLSAVRKVIHYSLEMEGVGAERAEEKMKMCEKLGDLCCSIKAFPAAIKFYKQQLSQAEAHGVDPIALSPMYISLAETHCDCCQYPEALGYYERELELKRGNATDECDTWRCIAAVRKRAGMAREAVSESYDKAYECANESSNPKLRISVCEAAVQYCKSSSGGRSELLKWEAELNCVLERHPDVGTESSGEEESDSQNLDGFETPESLSEMETDEEDEELVEESRALAAESNVTRGVAVRRKSKLFKRNERGETLLHLAAISGNLAAAKQLVNEGAEVNVRDNCGWLPLHEACNHGHIDIVEYLLDNGADVNDPGGIHCGGVSPLIDAASSGHTDIVQLLVLRGANLLHKDSKGYMAVDVLSERLASTTESYELEDEHAAIRDYLRGEMRKRGWVEKDMTIGQEDGTSRALPCARTRGHAGGSYSSRKRPSRGRGVTDRTGKDVLLSSDEDDSQTSSTAHETMHPLRDRAHISHEEPRTSGTCGKPMSLLCSGSGSGSGSRQVKRTADRADEPALISEDAHQIITGAFPVIDHWLEDDVGRPASKRRKAQKDPFTAIEDSDTERPRKRRPATVRSTHSTLSVGGRSGLKRVSGSDEARERAKEECQLIGVSLPEDGSTHQPSVTTCDAAVSHTQAQLTSPVPSRLTTTPATAPTPLPLRIRVKIDSKSYLIPCPANLADGSESTVQWLAQQASERYCTQQGVRPHLSLTTSDNALLSRDDVIAHVLQSGEEVIGVVEHWHLPPLPQRYQTACSSSGSEPHLKVLQLFQDSSSPSVLDLSHFSLKPAHLPPLLTALQGHSTLTSLSLCGNRLRNETLTLLANALSRHPSLHILDLSCTGITAQGLESLCNPSSSSSPHHTHHHTHHLSTPWSALRELHLGYNPLGAECGPLLSSLLSLTQGLVGLQLQSCGLEESVLERHTGLGQTLKSLSNLTDFVASLNPLQSSGIIQLLHSLPTGHLSHLDLANTCTQQPLTGALEHPRVVDFFTEVSSRLELLSFSHCRLDMHSLSGLLQHCQYVQELRLAAVGLTVDSLHPLTRLLEHWPQLKLLDVSGNEQLGNLGCLELVWRCSTMTDLKLKLASCGMQSPLSNELIKVLMELVLKNRIDIAGNVIDPADRKQIFSLS